MHNQSVCRRQLLLHYSVASIDTTLHSQLVGQGERARAAQEAMDALVDCAAKRERNAIQIGQLQPGSIGFVDMSKQRPRRSGM